MFLLRGHMHFPNTRSKATASRQPAAVFRTWLKWCPTSKNRISLSHLRCFLLLSCSVPKYLKT